MEIIKEIFLCVVFVALPIIALIIGELLSDYLIEIYHTL